MATRGLDKVLSFCERAGFLTSAAGFGIKYGPLGAQLKRNIVNEWWNAVVTSTGNVHPVVSHVLLDTNSNSSDQPDEHLYTVEGQNAVHKYQLRQSLNQEAAYEFYKKLMKVKIPFGVAEVGGVFQFVEAEKETVFKSKEVELGVLQFYCSSSEYKNWSSQWQKMRLRWWKKFAVNPEKFSLGKGDSEAPDLLSAIEFQFPQRPYNLEEVGGKELIQCSQSNEKSLVALCTNIDRAILAYIYDAFTETSRPYGNNSRRSIVLRLHSCLAPYQVAVIPKERANAKLNMYCKRLAEELRQVGISTTDWSRSSYEKDLLLQDVIGTPFRIVGSERTLESGTVMLQDRDTTVEEEINGRDVLTIIQRMLLGARLN